MWPSIPTWIVWLIPLLLLGIFTYALLIHEHPETPGLLPLSRKVMQRICLGIVATLILAIVMHLIRWSYIPAPSDKPTLYRIDRLTGHIDMSIAGQPWDRIETQAPQYPHYNQWGDPEVDAAGNIKL